MKRFKRFVCVFLVAGLLAGCAACTGSNKNAAEATLPSFSLAETEICVIDRAGLSDAEYLMLTSLQGLCAKTQAKIYIEDGGNLVFLEQYLKENSGVVLKRFDDVWSLVRENASALKDAGIVLFAPGDNTVNLAFTVSGMESWLAVPIELADRAAAEGLVVKRDLTEKENGAYTVTQEDLFAQYKDRLNKNLLIHQSPQTLTLRDYGVAAGAFCFYTDEADRAQKKFRQKVFAWANQNAVSFGWADDELGYVEQASQNAVAVIPSDHCSNLSLLSAMKLDAPLLQKNAPQQITPQKDKHYVALVMSDGDNAQWYETTLPFRDHYYDRVHSKADYKLTWTAPPLLSVLAPSVLQYVYDMATPNDRFICGVSGMGYINPTKYDRNALESFVSETAEAMRAADLQTLAVLDNSKSVKKLSRALAYYAQNRSLTGGLLQIEDKYEALAGKTVWCEGKPFVSVRRSFWFTSETEGETVSRQWIEEFAEKINAMPADIHSEDGYSYINVHPWSITIEDLDYLVSLLDEHIELVYADELIAMMAANI